MQRRQVKSSAISEVGYDPETETLEILFSSGGVYQYSPFKKADWEWFQLAKSIGSHFAREISGKFTAKKVEAEHAEGSAEAPTTEKSA